LRGFHFHFLAAAITLRATIYDAIDYATAAGYAIDCYAAATRRLLLADITRCLMIIDATYYLRRFDASFTICIFSLFAAATLMLICH